MSPSTALPRNRAQVALLVGDTGDPHLRAVSDLIAPGCRVVVDAASLERSVLQVTPEVTTLLTDAGEHVELPPAVARGWVRRVAPASWEHGTQLGSHQAAIMAARVSLLAAIMREPSVDWVTPIDRLYAAENKIIQYRAAMVAGLRVPRTLVAINQHELADELGEPFVPKPLGPGNFEADDRQHVVYVTSHRAADLAEADLLSAPFLAQSVIMAKKHLRCVTVDQEAWVAELDANELPLDWRSHGPAHSSFRAARWPETQADAIRLASSLGVGFSCQDWIVDDDGPVFLDLNPGGQWLFLPEAVSAPATRALADWLTRR